MALRLILGADRLTEFIFFFGRPLPAAGLDVVTAELAQHHRCLLATHHRDPRIRPHPQEARRIGTAAHAVVAGTERAAYHDRELRHAGGRDRGDELRTIASN